MQSDHAGGYKIQLYSDTEDLEPCRYNKLINPLPRVALKQLPIRYVDECQY